MKHLLVYLFCSIYMPFYVLAQNLTLADLIALSNKSDWAQVDKILSAKGWVYHNSKKGDETQYDAVSWSYRKDEYSDKAMAWFYVYQADGSIGKIAYDVFNKSSYNLVQKAISGSIYKLQGSQINDDAVETEYAGGNHTITVRYSKREKEEYSFETSLTAYSFLVQRNRNAYDHLNGLQKFTDEEGNTIEAMASNGKLAGTTKKYNPEGKLIFTAQFVNGEKHGIQKEWDSEGNLRTESTFLNGIMEGSYSDYEYYDSGVVFTYSGRMVNGEKNGLWNTTRVQGAEKHVVQFETYDNSGILHGPFKNISSDSIMVGSYRNGKLHGAYRIFRYIPWLFGEFNKADTSQAILAAEGYYNNGDRTGPWNNYDRVRSLVSQGNYQEDLKQGDWKYYYPFYPDEHSLAKYSGLLKSVVHYDTGKRNGKMIQYSYLEEIPVACDFKKNPDKTPLDTCYESRIVKSYSTYYYKEDLLHGPFEARDSADVLIQRGMYVNATRHGPFIETFISENEDGTKYYMYEEGNYENDQRQGGWKWYKHPAFIKMKGNYEKGELNGSFTYYNDAHQVDKEVNYSMGKYDIVTVYNAAQQKLRTYSKVSDNGVYISLQLEQFFPDSTIIQEYYLSKLDNAVINAVWLDGYFQQLLSDKEDNENNVYANGDFKKLDAKGNIIEEGEIYKEDKHGKWTYRFPGTGVYATQVFANGIPEAEYFFLENGNLPYSGELKLLQPNGKPKMEIDIEKGLRHGKTKFFTAEGKTEKTLKYKNGLLQP